LVTQVREAPAARQAALEELCELYWYPVYAFLRRRGHPRPDAEDLTQGFFVKLLGDRTFEAAQAQRGRLRTFLLSSLERHLADHHRRQGAIKRGAGWRIIAFEELRAEERYTLEPADHWDPEKLFARTWTQLLLRLVREKLRDSFEEAGRAGVFEALLPFLLLEEAPPSYREVADRLDASEAAVRLMVFRARNKFRELLRNEVAQTVQRPEEIEGELQWITTTLAQ
jgi:RNA polymerase sigma-70 factor (ECF subfamily)